MLTLVKGQTYTARTTGTLDGVRIYHDITFIAAREGIEPFIRGEGRVDQDRVFRSDRKFGSTPLLVVTGSITAA